MRASDSSTSVWRRSRTATVLIGVGIACGAVVIAIGSAAFLAYELTNTELASAEAAAAIVTAARSGIAQRQPMIEIGTPVVRRSPPAAHAPIRVLHLLAYNASSRKLVRSDLPVWLLRWISIDGQIRLANVDAWGGAGRVTLDDLERYGPGVIVDMALSDERRLLVWAS